MPLLADTHALDSFPAEITTLFFCDVNGRQHPLIGGIGHPRVGVFPATRSGFEGRREATLVLPQPRRGQYELSEAQQSGVGLFDDQTPYKISPGIASHIEPFRCQIAQSAASSS